MKDLCFVGFDTSNYTTSASFCNGEGRVIANLKAPLPVKEGEKGLRQSDAVFAHIRNLPTLTQQLSEALKEYSPAGVCVSATPRDAQGSYMPCFLSGVAAANAFASALHIPVFTTSHQNGHIMAAAYSSGKLDVLKNERFLAFHLSGGTTEAVIAEFDEKKHDFAVSLVGETADISAGQAIDRVGVMMGLKFPCGAELEKLASENCKSFEKKRVSVTDGRCSMSGIENMAEKLYSKTDDKALTAAFVFDFICRNIAEMTRQIIGKYGEMPVLYAGGVMSNRLMRAELSAEFDACFAEPCFCSDNAAGVALLCREKYLSEEKREF